MLNDSLLALANLLTSALTAITGVGGGMILIGLMPFFVPAAAIVPVHGVTQLVSNATRLVWSGCLRLYLFLAIFGGLIDGTVDIWRVSTLYTFRAYSVIYRYLYLTNNLAKHF
ncbi:hypothetical protein ACH0AB_03230 [Moraxella sp. 179-F 1C4 NHS]